MICNLLVEKNLLRKDLSFAERSNTSKQTSNSNCDKSPTNLTDLDYKIKSRLSGGLVVDIQLQRMNCV